MNKANKNKTRVSQRRTGKEQEEKYKKKRRQKEDEKEEVETGDRMKGKREKREGKG